MARRLETDFVEDPLKSCPFGPEPSTESTAMEEQLSGDFFPRKTTISEQGAQSSTQARHKLRVGDLLSLQLQSFEPFGIRFGHRFVEKAGWK
jgi:hypothetical protein